MTLRTQLLLQRIKDKLNSFFKVFGQFFAWKNKKFYLLASLILIIFGIGVAGYFVNAAGDLDFAGQLGDLIFKGISYILYGLAYALGWIAMQIFKLVIFFSTYNDFVTSVAVTKGWVIIRDVCNMLIVLILLVYAFAKILQLPRYSDPKILPRLIIAAVLINFSKLFCGLLIDLAQVFMMTFVNGYAATAGPNLINGLGLTKVLEFDQNVNNQGEIKWDEIFVMLISAIFFLFFTLVVIIMIAGLLVMRIVALWILVVLSPLGFLGLTDFPKITTYTKEWWDAFANYVLLGPVLAFFLWLALLVMSNADENIGKSDVTAMLQEQKLSGDVAETKMSALWATDQLVVSFIGLALLFGAFEVSKRLSGSVGKKWAGAVSGVGARVAKRYTGVEAVSTAYQTYRGRVQAKRKERYTAMGERAFIAREAGVAKAKKVASVPVAAVGGVVKGVARAPRGFARGYAEARAAGGGVLQGLGEGMKQGAVGLGVEGWRAGAQTYRKAGSREMGTVYSDEKKKIEDQKKELETAGTSDEDLSKLVLSGAKRERLAAAQMLLEKDKFGKVKDKKGRSIIKQEYFPAMADEMTEGMSPVMQKKFKKQIKEKNALFAYDLSSKKGKDEMKSDMEKGKLNMSAQPLEVWENDTFRHMASETMGGKAYRQSLKDQAKKNKANKEKVQTIIKKDFNIELKRKKGEGDEEYNKRNKDAQYNNRAVFADVTGDVDQAFEETKDIEKYFKEVSVNQLVEVDYKKVDKIENKDKKQAVQKAMANGVSTSQLNSMMKKNEVQKTQAVVNNMLEAREQMVADNDPQVVEINKKVEVLVNNPNFSGENFEKLQQVSESIIQAEKKEADDTKRKAKNQAKSKRRAKNTKRTKGKRK